MQHLRASRFFIKTKNYYQEIIIVTGILHKWLIFSYLKTNK